MGCLQMKKLIALWIVLCLGEIVCSQNTIGIPNIINYFKQDYNAGRQNWDIAQDSRGIMYFANNNGLLTFDGSFWRNYPIPNGTIVRSLAIDKNDRIYVGGQQEFGYFYPNGHGELVYTSLRNLLKNADNDYTDVWTIQIVGDHIFFHAYRKIFEYAHGVIKAYNSTYWSFLGYSNNELLAYNYENGLVYYNNGQWLPRIKTGTLPAGTLLKSVIDLGHDSLLLTSISKGLYILKGDVVTPFETRDIKDMAAKNIFGACLLSPETIAFNTNLGGCVIMDRNGKFIQRLTKNEGIQNNNVQKLFLDKDKNLWLALDNGIDLVTYNNAIKNIFPEPNDRNSGYTSIVHNNRLYLGVATGLYKTDLPPKGGDISYAKSSFSLVENSKGQVWNVSEVNGQLLMGHNLGAYVINNDKATLFDNKNGFWLFLPLYDSFPSSVIIAGTYNGLNFYNYSNNHITSISEARFESARFIVKNKDLIWAAHPYKGLTKVAFNEKNKPVVTYYNDKKKILSKNHNHLYRVANRMVLTTDNGVFEFDDAIDDFKPSAFFKKLFGNAPVDYLKEDKAGNIWFCSNKRIGVAELKAGNYQLVYIPELDDKVSGNGFENINIIDSNNVLIAAEKGFFHINYAQYKKSKYPLTTLIRNVQESGKKDDLIFGGYPLVNASEAKPSIGYASNTLHFECSAIIYGQQHNTTYSYYLKGFDTRWSEWNRKTEKEYTNLPPGQYVFQVKCRTNVDNESAVASFSFTILPPWYRTWWAFILYGVALFALLYWFYKRQQFKYRKREAQKLLQQKQRYAEEQKQLQILHELEMGKREKEIIELKNEKLQNDIEYKNSQLASAAMNLVRKMEIFAKIKDDLSAFKNNEEFKAGSKELQKVIRLIDSELDVTQEWEQFTEHFDQVHSHFLKKLKEQFPDLTSTELKMAAYLRLNLTSKEIAQLMSISIRGVETGRYRLRKKLGLTSNETSLYDFLISITG
jgi:ligand-binding sensor domain-containing protein